MRGRFGGIVLAAVLLIIPRAIDAKTDAEYNKASSSDQKRAYRSVMPMLSMQASPLPVSGKDRKSPVGGYTRIEAMFEPTPEMASNLPRDYNAEERGWWRRLFASKKIGRLLTVKAAITRPQITTTTALSSLGHDSGQSVGENWSTDFAGRRALTPYFRIDPDSVLTLEASLAASSSYDASVATGLLDVLRRAATLVAPTATLATSVSDERYLRASQFIDQSISNLFKQSVTERKLDDFALKAWAGAPLATISVMIPTGNDVTPPRNSIDSKHRTIPIGEWIVSATKPVLSMFSDRLLDDPEADDPETKDRTQQKSDRHGTQDKAEKIACSSSPNICLAFAGVTPPVVLGFQIVNDLSVRQALAAEGDITTARDRLIAAGANSSNATEAVRTLCGAIATKAHLLGFNRYDVGAIVWAYANDTFGTDAARSAMADPTQCPPLAVAFAIGLPRDGFTAEGAGQQSPAASDAAVSS